MEIVFYLSSLIAIAATLRVITHTNPVHALLYLIITLLAISAVFFSLGAYFAGALAIIVYAGAIMVLFVFILMMLNLDHAIQNQEKIWMKPSVWVGPGLLSLALLMVMIIAIHKLSHQEISGEIIDAKVVGMSLFGPYVLSVELVSMILLAGLVVTFHIGREKKTRTSIEQKNYK